MNIITIEFAHLTAEQPTYTFGARVAVVEGCSPKTWARGKVVGLQLDETPLPRWWYTVWLDAPLGLSEEYLDLNLVSETEIPALQASWDEASHQVQDAEPDFDEPDFDDSLPDWADHYGSFEDYLIHEYPEAINPDLASGY